mgnify:FL=1
MENSNLILNNTHFISSTAREVLSRHLPHLCDEQMFNELEDMCRIHVQKRMREYQAMMNEKEVISKTAKNVIERIDGYFNYSLVKNNHKMRLTRKEYDYMMNRLSETEKLMVEKWLEDNGGLDKYIFSGYAA